uniref:Uncharacterized protein n=1 Tax=Geospiza parvula TaxID=87175 RepID=A0A8C3MGB8_GEOPR
NNFASPRPSVLSLLLANSRGLRGPLRSPAGSELPLPRHHGLAAPRHRSRCPRRVSLRGTPGRKRRGAASYPGRGAPPPPGSQAGAKKKAACPGLGLFYTILSAFLFSVASLFLKKIEDVHSVEVSAFRCVFQMAFVLP